jgi:hypothetical protein
VAAGVGLTAVSVNAGPPFIVIGIDPVSFAGDGSDQSSGRIELVSKRKKVASVMFTGTAAAAVTGVGIQPAAAAPVHWSIAPGGAYTATNTTNATLTANGFTATCFPGTVNASGSLSGNSTNGDPAVPPGVQLGTVDSATFGSTSSPCTLFGQDIIATLDSPIGIFATGLTTPNNATGVTPGRLGTTINATITGINGFNCNMHVTGTTVPGEYQNPNVLRVNAANTQTLTIDAVTGCGGLFQVGNPAAFRANFTLNANQVVTHNP